MEYFIASGDNRFIVGLEWLKITGSDPVLAGRSQAKARKCAKGLIRSIDIGDDQLAHQVALCHTKVKGQVYSAAAHMANLYPSMIAIDRLENDLYWICVSDNGRILPGHDVAATDSEIRTIFNDLASEYQLEFMTLIMPKSLARMIGVSDFIDESPFKIMAENTPEITAKIKNIIGVPTSVYLAFSIVSIIAGGGAYLKHMDAKKEAAIQEMIAREAMEEEERARQRLEDKAKEVTDADLLERARKEEILWLRDDFNNLSTISALKYIYVLSNSMPIKSSGWSIGEIGFSSSNPKQIVGVWNRNGGSIRSLKQYFNNRAAPYFRLDAKEASVSHKIDLGSLGVSDIVQYLESDSINYQEVSDLLIMRGFDFSISLIANNDRREIIKGLKDKSLESFAQFAVRKRMFSISGADKNKYVDFMDVMQHIPNMLPQTITADLKEGSFKWSFTGILYEI